MAIATNENNLAEICNLHISVCQLICLALGPNAASLWLTIHFYPKSLVTENVCHVGVSALYEQNVVSRPIVCCIRDVHGLDSSMDWIGLDWVR